MNTEAIVDWATRTIPGILTAGILGSVLATLLLRLIALFRDKVLLRGVRNVKAAEKRFGYRSGFLYGAASRTHDVPKLLAFFSYHLAMFGIFLGGFVIAALWLGVVLYTQGKTTLTWSAFILSTLAWLLLRFTLMRLSLLRFAFNHEFSVESVEADQQLKKEKEIK